MTAQEELKAKIEKMTYNFNIKKHYMEKDRKFKQSRIESLEAKNIALKTKFKTKKMIKYTNSPK